MKAVLKKELGHYFNNPFGYIIVVLASLLVNGFFLRDVYSIGIVSLKPLFIIHYWVFILLIPALCMRSFAEERKLGTLEGLLTLPLKEVEIVTGKLSAILVLIGTCLLMSMVLPVSFSLLSGLYLPEVVAGYAGLLLSAVMFSLFCMYISLKTSNQVVAFFISSIGLFLLSIFSSDLVASFIPRLYADVVIFLTPLFHLENFTRGIIDARSVFYFLSFSAVFFYAAVTQLKHRD